jgi:FkbM family methyltransferase
VKVVAVEPDPGNAAICRTNTLGWPVQVIQAAIGSTPGTVSLLAEGQEAMAIQTERDSTGEVPITTIPDILADQGADAALFMVKVDIEGFESDLFETNTGWVDDAAVLFVEPHDWLLPGRATSRSFQRLMSGQDFEVLISGENLIYVR